MKIFNTIMCYLRERQSPLIRFLHITILLLVLSQIVLSNFMEFNKAGEISTNTIDFYGTWLHIIFGLFTIPVALIYLVVELKKHGFKYFSPYLSGEFSQLKNDVDQLIKLSLPEPSAYGLAAVVQGLGFGALFMVLFSGLIWFLSWNFNLSWSDDVKEIHEFLTGLIQAYIIGHGCMGILHIFFGSKLQKIS